LRRSCLLKHVTGGMIEGRIEVKGRWERSCKQLLDDLTKIIVYWKLQREALDRILWRTHFGRRYGSVVRQTNERMDIFSSYLTGQNHVLGMLYASCQGMDLKYFEDIPLTIFAAHNSYKLTCHKYSYISQSRIRIGNTLLHNNVCIMKNCSPEMRSYYILCIAFVYKDNFFATLEYNYTGKKKLHQFTKYFSEVG
jgi:hypothetical protein